MIIKLYTVSTTLIGEGDSITIVSATSAGGRFWDFQRQYIGAAGARSVHETVSSKELLSRFKLLSLDSSATNKTDIAFATTIFDPEIPGKTIIKNDQVNIKVMGDEDIEIEVHRHNCRITLISTKSGTTTYNIVGDNAEEFFGALGEIC